MCTKTRLAWGQKKITYENKNNKFIKYYKYKNKYPHASSGKVNFKYEIFWRNKKAWSILLKEKSIL